MFFHETFRFFENHARFFLRDSLSERDPMPTIKELIQQQEARQEHDRRHAHAKSTLPQAPMWLWHRQPPILMAPTGRHGELEPQGRVG